LIGEAAISSKGGTEPPRCKKADDPQHKGDKIMDVGRGRTSLSQK